MPKIYVGTYAKYNAGSLEGKWFDLEEYACKDDFIEACQEFHGQDQEHEFMFQDHEGIPPKFISESWIDPEFWYYMDFNDGYSGEAKEAFVNLFDLWDEDEFQDRFNGKFDSWKEMAEEILEETGELQAIPESLRYYFDFEAYARDIRLNGDMCEANGYFFLMG